MSYNPSVFSVNWMSSAFGRRIAAIVRYHLKKSKHVLSFISPKDRVKSIASKDRRIKLGGREGEGETGDSSVDLHAVDTCVSRVRLSLFCNV